MENTKIIPCTRCKHYFVSYNSRTPRGCKLYGFESHIMPYVIVKQSTGKDCEEYSPKNSNNGSNGGNKDFNDPKYW